MVSFFVKHERSFPHIQEGEPAFFCHGLYRAVSHGRIERGVQLGVGSFIMNGNAAPAAERSTLAAPSVGTGYRPGAARLDETVVLSVAAAAICCPFPKFQDPLTGAAAPAFQDVVISPAMGDVTTDTLSVRHGRMTIGRSASGRPCRENRLRFIKNGFPNVFPKIFQRSSCIS